MEKVKQTIQITINVTPEELELIDKLILNNPGTPTRMYSTQRKKLASVSRTSLLRDYLLAQARFNAEAIMDEDGHLYIPEPESKQVQ